MNNIIDANDEIIEKEKREIVSRLRGEISFIICTRLALNRFNVCSAKDLKTLLSYMEEDWRTIADKQERKIMLDTANFTRKLSIRSTVLVQTVVMLYVVLHYVTTRQIGRHWFFQSNFPYNATKSPYYELTLFGEYVGSIYAATSYTAVDTFIATLVLHICSQLSNLRYRLLNLCANTKAEFQTKLGNIVKKHEDLNR